MPNYSLRFDFMIIRAEIVGYKRIFKMIDCGWVLGLIILINMEESLGLGWRAVKFPSACNHSY